MGADWHFADRRREEALAEGERKSFCFSQRKFQPILWVGGAGVPCWTRRRSPGQLRTKRAATSDLDQEEQSST